MTDARDEQKQGLSERLLLGGLIVVAFVLRFARLGLRSLDSDEVFMRRDSLNFRFTNPRPLLYWLNHYVIGAVRPLERPSWLIAVPRMTARMASPAAMASESRLSTTRPQPSLRT